MALPTPNGSETNNNPVLLKAIRDNGLEGHLGMTEDGELKVQAEITVGESIGVKAVAGALTNVYGTVAAPKSLTVAVQNGATITTNGNQSWVFSLRLDRSAATRVDVYFEISLDGTTWDRVQDEVSSGSVTTLSDGEFQKAVSGDKNWSIAMNFRGAPYFRLSASGVSASGDTLVVLGYPVSLN